MNLLVPIDQPDDPRLLPYRNIRHQEPNEGFIAEGSLVVKRLLQSDHVVDSLLVYAGQESKYGPLVPTGVPIYVIPRALGQAIAGYDFHRGVLAHGRRKRLGNPSDFVKQISGAVSTEAKPRTSLGLVGISDPENVGGLLRTAAAFGIHDILVDRDTISPYTRRVIRVSMASVFEHRFYEWTPSPAAMHTLHDAGIATIASTLASDATPIENLRRQLSTKPRLLLMGNEASGLSLDVQNSAQLRVTIAMHPSTDSLNVGVAGGIVMHELTRGASSDV